VDELVVGQTIRYVFWRTPSEEFSFFSLSPVQPIHGVLEIHPRNAGVQEAGTNPKQSKESFFVDPFHAAGSRPESLVHILKIELNKNE
jgi:hypothetical protein